MPAAQHLAVFVDWVRVPRHGSLQPRNGFAGELQGGCKPEGGAAAPVAELLRGAGLRVSELGGAWALRGQVLSFRGALTVQQTLLARSARPPHLLGPFTHLQGSVSFWVLHSEEEEKSVLQIHGLWVERGSVLVFPGVQCRQGALGVEPVGSLTSPPGPTPPASPWADDI